MTLSETIRTVLSPPHPAGRPFITIGAVLALAGFFVGAWLLWPGLLFLAFSLYFFRDPERVALGHAGAVVAPADGRVVSVGPATPPAELGLGGQSFCRVAIFLSVMDVHVNRAPMAGVVTRVAYRHGKFVNASLDKASEHNERNSLAIRLDDGRMMAVVQIAGLIARRIVCQAKEGDRLETGERFGLIRFGSRTDVYLPAGTVPLVAEGQTMIGGETLIAQLGVAEAAARVRTGETAA